MARLLCQEHEKDRSDDGTKLPIHRGKAWCLRLRPQSHAQIQGFALLSLLRIPKAARIQPLGPDPEQVHLMIVAESMKKEKLASDPQGC